MEEGLTTPGVTGQPQSVEEVTEYRTLQDLADKVIAPVNETAQFDNSREQSEKQFS